MEAETEHMTENGATLRMLLRVDGAEGDTQRWRKAQGWGGDCKLYTDGATVRETKPATEQELQEHEAKHRGNVTVFFVGLMCPWCQAFAGLHK